jgi:hypothetical protein
MSFRCRLGENECTISLDGMDLPECQHLADEECQRQCVHSVDENQCVDAELVRRCAKMLQQYHIGEEE